VIVRFRVILAALAALALAAPAAAQDEAALIQNRLQVREMVRDSLAALYEIQPVARYAIDRAAGYGLFSTFGIKIFFAGGGTGSGVVVDNRTDRDTFMKMVKVQAGLGFGASKDRLVFVFETQNALRNLVT
jgi:lipid-binding SYLF domain-containing protein